MIELELQTEDICKAMSCKFWNDDKAPCIYTTPDGLVTRRSSLGLYWGGNYRLCLACKDYCPENVKLNFDEIYMYTDEQDSETKNKEDVKL